MALSSSSTSSSSTSEEIMLSVNKDYVENFKKLLRPLNLKVVSMESDAPTLEEIEVLRNTITEKEKENGLLKKERENWTRSQYKFVELLLKCADETLPKTLIDNVMSTERHYHSIVEHVENFFNKRSENYKEFKKQLLQLVQGASVGNSNPEPVAGTSNSFYNGYGYQHTAPAPTLPTPPVAPTSQNEVVCPINISGHLPLPTIPPTSPSIIIELEKSSPNATSQGVSSTSVKFETVEPANHTTASTSSQSQRQPSAPRPQKKSTPQHRMRKLQSEILKRKKHAVFLTKDKSTAAGLSSFRSWWCVCGSRFVSKCKLLTHIQYFTHDWKFKCHLCVQTFLYLGYLKKHMTTEHGILEPLQECVAGCHYCGGKFRSVKEYNDHKKSAHQLYPQQRRCKPALNNRGHATTTLTREIPQVIEMIDLSLDGSTENEDLESAGENSNEVLGL